MSGVLMRWVFRGDTLALALYRADDIRIFIATPFVSALVVTVLVSIRAGSIRNHLGTLLACGMLWAVSILYAFVLLGFILLAAAYHLTWAAARSFYHRKADLDATLLFGAGIAKIVAVYIFCRFVFSDPVYEMLGFFFLGLVAVVGAVFALRWLGCKMQLAICRGCSRR